MRTTRDSVQETMKKLTEQEIAEVKGIFGRYNESVTYEMNEAANILKVGLTAITTLESIPLIKAGYLLAVFANICDDWHDKALTVHVFKAGE